MQEISQLRRLLNAKYPNGHRLVKKTNTNYTKPKK